MTSTEVETRRSAFTSDKDSATSVAWQPHALHGDIWLHARERHCTVLVRTDLSQL